MSLPLRVALVLAGVAGLVLGAGFFFQLKWAVELWPLAAGRLSNIFVASILAAIAAPVVWIGLVGEPGAMAAGALNLAVTYGGIAVFSFQPALAAGKSALLRFSVGCGVVALLCVFIFLWSRGKPLREDRLTPSPVRWSFALFAVILALVGGSLALKRPHVFPWPITPETSVIYGWVFLGAMCYFADAFLHPRWGNARGQLLGFLAYDLVLIGPYRALFKTVKPELRLNLIIYVAVIVYSGLLAAFYLFLGSQTRYGARHVSQGQVA
jgi:hypothetical protein